MPQKLRQRRLSQVEIKMLFSNVTSEPFCFLNKLHIFNNFSLSAKTCGATAILDYIYFPIPVKLYINGFNARIWSVCVGLKGLNGSTLPYLAWLFRIGRGCVEVVHLGVIYTALVLSAWEWTLSQKLFLLQLFRCRIMRPRYDKRVSQSSVTVVEFPHGDAFNEQSLPRCTQSVTTSCIQQWLPLLLLVAAWQLTSDAPCSSWSLFNKLDPPISFQPSGLTLRLPAPLGWPWCHRHVGVPKAQVAEYIYQSPHPTLPHLNWPGCPPLVRTGFFPLL